MLYIDHDDVIKWKHFPRYWPFVRGIHRSPVNSPHKGQWRGALMFSLICARINGWVNNREAGDLRRYRAHYDVIVMVVTFVVSRGPRANMRDGSNSGQTHHCMKLARQIIWLNYIIIILTSGMENEWTEEFGSFFTTSKLWISILFGLPSRVSLIYHEKIKKIY